MTSSPTSKPVDALAERVDRAGDVDAGGVRQRHRERALHEAAADVAVDGVERRRGDADPDLAGAGDGLLHVLVAQDVGVAVLVETHCLHAEPRFALIDVLRIRSICDHGSTLRIRSK